MNFEIEILENPDYHSKSQVARVRTENWVEQNLYCVVCGNIRIRHFENNRPVADFYCEICGAEFELKSKENQKNFPKKIVNGAYKTLIERITSCNNPDLLCMTHKDWKVQNLFLIPKFFFTPKIIEKRKPLALTAQRAGWTGSNIEISKVPETGQIFVIKNQKIIEKNQVLAKYQKVKLLEMHNIESRGWLLDTLFFVERLNVSFTLTQVFEFETDLKKLHPENNNIRAKIRQQLQFLRDKGFIVFNGNGNYSRL